MVMQIVKTGKYDGCEHRLNRWLHNVNWWKVLFLFVLSDAFYMLNNVEGKTCELRIERYLE
jgi:hypothetical protein